MTTSTTIQVESTDEALAESIASESLGLSPYRLREIAAHLNNIAEERDNK